MSSPTCVGETLSVARKMLLQAAVREDSYRLEFCLPDAARSHLDEGLLFSVFLMSLFLSTSISLHFLLYSLLISGWPSLPTASTTNSRGDSYNSFTSFSLVQSFAPSYLRDP